MKKSAAKTLLSHGVCLCIRKPWASTRLEGFDEDFQYRFQHVTDGKTSWYRVYPVELDSLASAGIYYETIGSRQFSQFFTRTWASEAPASASEYTVPFMRKQLRFAAAECCRTMEKQNG